MLAIIILIQNRVHQGFHLLPGIVSKIHVGMYSNARYVAMCLHMHMHLRTSAPLCVCIYLYTCAYIYIYGIWMYTHMPCGCLAKASKIASGHLKRSSRLQGGSYGLQRCGCIIYIYIHFLLCMCIYLFICESIYACIYVYTCMYTDIHIYIYRERYEQM